ncbi:unnamed protein product [Schistosoma turkestanicum]|nr:unnamed protein product [Schistosoma turkestanicum]
MAPTRGGKNETEISKLTKDLLKDYEQRANHYEVASCNSVKLCFKKAADDNQYLTRLLIDPQDHKTVDYWIDDKLTVDKSAILQAKDIENKQLKEKRLVKILPLIETIRAKRYTAIQEIDVWDCHIENDDMIALTQLVNKGCYLITRIELINCFLNTKCIHLLAVNIALSKILRELCLDFNEIGEQGCHALCDGLIKNRYLIYLSLRFCGLTKQCGVWLGDIIAETAIRQLILDGNSLEAEGTIALLSQISDAAEKEGHERAEEIRKKQLAAEESENKDRAVLNNPTAVAEGENANAGPAPQSSPPKASSKNKGGKKDKNQPLVPPSGPQISVLKLADNAINHYGEGGNITTVKCMQIIKSIISYSKDLEEIDLFANDIGDLAARQILEGLLCRKDAKLPKIGVRLGHRINQDTFDKVQKLAPGPKKKKGKKGKK